MWQGFRGQGEHAGVRVYHAQTQHVVQHMLAGLDRHVPPCLQGVVLVKALLLLWWPFTSRRLLILAPQLLIYNLVGSEGGRDK